MNNFRNTRVLSVMKNRTEQITTVLLSSKITKVVITPPKEPIIIQSVITTERGKRYYKKFR